MEELHATREHREVEVTDTPREISSRSAKLNGPHTNPATSMKSTDSTEVTLPPIYAARSRVAYAWCPHSSLRTTCGHSRTVCSSVG